MAMWICPTCRFEVDDSIFSACPYDGTTKDQANASAPQCSPRGCSLPKPENAMGPGLVLVESATGEEIRIRDRSCILGREGRYRPELFSGKVSRMHLEINYEDGKWTAGFLGRNDTYLSSRSDGHLKMVAGIEYPLHSGDKIRFPGNQSFLVRIEEEAASEENHPADVAQQDKSAFQQDFPETAPEENSSSAVCQPEDEMIEGWFIRCNKCGSTFQVENASSRLNECPRCIDVMDKRDIRRASAVFGERSARVVIDVR